MKLLSFRLLILFPLLLTQTAQAEPTYRELAEQRKQIEKLLYSPSRSPYDNNVSLEWTIDASDAILTVRLDDQRKPKLEKVFKPLEGKVSWPVGNLERLRAICELYEPGDHIAFFLWQDPQDKGWSIFEYIPLLSEDIRQERLKTWEQNVPLLDESGAQTHHYRMRAVHGLNWLTIDKTGKWIGDVSVILDRITQRVKAGSRIPPGADRQAVLEDKSVYGGFYKYEPQEPTVSAAEFPLVLVPPDPEYRQMFLDSVRSVPPHQGKTGAIRLIANYKDEETIDALKQLRHDPLYHELWYSLPERYLRNSTFHILTLETPPLLPDPQMEKSRTFILRKAAWESLQQMGVKVEPPELHPK